MKNDIFNKAIDFLKNNENILDIDNWKSFQIDFSVFEKDKIRKQIINEVEFKLGHKNKSGLYAIKKGNDILYVGKANILYKRLFDHYRETHLTNYPLKYKKWYDFFNENCKKEITIKIISINICDDSKISHPFIEFIEQVVISKYYKYIEFETFRLNIKTIKK